MLQILHWMHYQTNGGAYRYKYTICLLLCFELLDVAFSPQIRLKVKKYLIQTIKCNVAIESGLKCASVDHVTVQGHRASQVLSERNAVTVLMGVNIHFS